MSNANRVPQGKRTNTEGGRLDRKLELEHDDTILEFVPSRRVTRLRGILKLYRLVGAPNRPQAGSCLRLNESLRFCLKLEP